MTRPIAVVLSILAVAMIIPARLSRAQDAPKTPESIWLEAEDLDVVVHGRRHVLYEICRIRFAHLLSSAPIDTR